MKSIKFSHLFSKSIQAILFILCVIWIYTPYHTQGSFAPWIEAGWLLLATSFIIVLPKWIDTLMGSVMLSILSLDIWVQMVYFRAFGQYGRLTTLFSLQSELKASVDSASEFVNAEDFKYIGILIVYILISLLFQWMRKQAHQKWLWQSLMSGVFILGGVYSVNAFRNNIETDRLTQDIFFYYDTQHYVYTTVPNTLEFVDEFGLLGLFQRDLMNLIVDPLVSDLSGINDNLATLLEGTVSEKANEFTGIFEGKSILMIEAESLMNLAIDPVLTPTLYRLQTNGINFTGYNSPLLAGSTSDTEFMAITSLLPANDGTNTFMTYYDNTYPVTLANVFKDNDYYALAAHNNYSEFYNRDEMLPNLGFDFWDSYRMGFEGQMILDSAFIEPIKWISFERDKFFSYWITFNGHQPYSLSDLNPDLLDYYTHVELLYPNLPEAEKVYLAKNMDLDKAIESMIRDFTYSGRIEDLVIVLFGDHFAKGAFSETSSIEQLCLEANNECVKTPFIIWYNDSVIQTISTPSNPLDILPTVFDLMGFDYAQEFTLGHSLFNPAYEGFYFNAWGEIVLGDIVYNSVEDKYKDPLDDTPTHDQWMVEAQQYLELAPKLVETNYYASQACLEAFDTCVVNP